MPASTTTVDSLVFDGPLALAAAIGLGLLLIAFCGWSLWRERSLLSLRYFALFWTLRTVAVAVALWLLLAPQQVRIETSSTKRAVVLMMDVSGSMQTVDPPGTAEELRWEFSGNANRRSAVTAASDRAAAALGLARYHLQQAIIAVKEHKAEADVRSSIAAARLALQHVEDHLALARSIAAASPELTRLISKGQQLLADAEFEEFARLCLALEKGRTPPQKGWQDSLADLEYRVSGVKSVLDELAHRSAAAETARLAAAAPELLADVQRRTRLDRQSRLVEHLEAEVLANLRQRADVRLWSFAESVSLTSAQSTPTSAAQSGDGRQIAAQSLSATTNLSAMLERVLRDEQEQPVAAVIVVSDAAHNAAGAENPRDVAAKLAETPVYFVPIGNPGYIRDVQLQSISAPAVAMRNDDIVIEARIEAHECSGEACSVQLLQDGELIDSRSIAFDSAFATRTVRFDRLMATIGPQQFQIEITPLDGESTTENNYRGFEVQVTRSDLKLLLADELPRWEYRYLAQLFRRDDKVQCDELLFHPRPIATGRRQDTGTFPATVDEWDQYDVVILGDLAPAHLPIAAQESLAEYLAKRGGTAVVIAGRESMPHAFKDHPLEELLPVVPLEASSPVDPAGYAFRVTPQGADHHALMIAETDDATRAAWEFVNKFAPLHELSHWRQPRPTARTLIAAIPRNSLETEELMQRNAFLCWQPVGRGRIVYLSGPETYRLRFLRGDRLHYRFWGQLLRWAIASDLAVGTELVRIRTDRSRYRTGEPVQFVVQLTDEQGNPVTTDQPLRIRLAAGETEQHFDLHPANEAPGEYVAELTALPPGVYRAEPRGDRVEQLLAASHQERTATASFTVEADIPEELVDTRCNRALAQQVASVTGGQVIPPTAIQEVLALTNLEPVVSRRVERRPLWLQWKYLWLLFACLQCEWLVRKWFGLS